jgi:hypothetical protein
MHGSAQSAESSQAFHSLANPRCVTPEQARKVRWCREAVKRELSAQGISYADILGAKPRSRR